MKIMIAYDTCTTVEFGLDDVFPDDGREPRGAGKSASTDRCTFGQYQIANIRGPTFFALHRCDFLGNAQVQPRGSSM